MINSLIGKDEIEDPENTNDIEGKVINEKISVEDELKDELEDEF